MSHPPLDNRPVAEEDHQRSILDDLLYFFPGPYAMLSAFLDESGTGKDEPVMCVAGLLYERHHAKNLDRAWKRALSQAGIRCFHAVDAAHFRGEFEGKSRDFRDELYRQLVGLVVKHACGGAAVYTLPKAKFDAFREGKWDYGQYATCAHFCMLLLRKIAKRLNHRKVHVVIEAGHENMGELRNLLKELSDLGYREGSWQFNEKDQLRPLETADLWAYEARKRIRDQYTDSPHRQRMPLRILLGGSLDAEAYFLGKKELQQLFDRKTQIMGE